MLIECSCGRYSHPEQALTKACGCFPTRTRNWDKKEQEFGCWAHGGYMTISGHSSSSAGAEMEPFGQPFRIGPPRCNGSAVGKSPLGLREVLKVESPPLFRWEIAHFGSLAPKFKIQQCSDESMWHPKSVVNVGGALIEFEQYISWSLSVLVLWQ